MCGLWRKTSWRWERQYLQNDPQNPCLVSGMHTFLCFCSFTHRMRAVIHARCLLSSHELPIGWPWNRNEFPGRVAITAMLGTNCMLLSYLMGMVSSWCVPFGSLDVRMVITIHFKNGRETLGATRSSNDPSGSPLRIDWPFKNTPVERFPLRWLKTETQIISGLRFV